MRVTLENLTKYFGRVVGAEDVNLEMGHGEFVALLGPSGCGKTTTLLMVAGIYKPTRGYVYFDDRVVNDLPPKDRNVGMVFQSYALYPHMTVFDNITFPLKLQKVPREEMEQRAQRVADMLGIGVLMDRKPAQLSGGQQQRVAVARALVKEPSLLLFDEPLSNLDAKLRLRMRGELKRLQMELGITTIYVTHDQVEAMTMADRIAVMNAGLLQAYGPPEKLYDHPETMFVAAFIGSPPMSFLEMAFEEREDGFYLRGKGLDLRLPDEKGHLAKRNNAPDQVVMGIRPEDIIVGPEGDVRAEVYVVEPLGREDLVTFHLDGEEVRVLIPAPFGGKIGEVMGLSLNKEKLHLFDPRTEKSLLVGG
ncbi:MAG: ABC transporter ATP-binding protein [Anaerolineae bacterium]